MIYLTGDIHGGISIHKLSNKQLRKQNINLTEKDYLIILGDFGLPFFWSDVFARKGEYLYWIKWLANKPCTILWVDGNHENHRYWESIPTSEWNGGKVQIHPLAKNVIHLMRGEIYTIEGKSFFVMGGANSHDKEHRVAGVTWWEEEIPSTKELYNGLDNLEARGFKVDYILSHCIGTEIEKRILQDNWQEKDSCVLGKYFDLIADKSDFKYWLFGHYHQNIILKNRFICLYNAVIALPK